MEKTDLLKPAKRECDFCGESVVKYLKISCGNISAIACDSCKDELFKNFRV